jgi:hypothetical protein
MFDKFLNYCEEAYNRVHELYENDDEFRGFIQAYALGSMVGMTALTICYWLGHPEWALSRSANKLIVKNMSAKKK